MTLLNKVNERLNSTAGHGRAFSSTDLYGKRPDSFSMTRGLSGESAHGSEKYPNRSADPAAGKRRKAAVSIAMTSWMACKFDPS